jgi:DNA-binding transcriptional MocR family regulator
VELKRLEDCGTSSILQAALDVFLADGGLSTHLERVLPEYRTRRDRMLSSLDRAFPAAARWTRPSGGLFVWATLPEGFDGNELFVAARQRGVLYSRGELFHGDGAGRNSLRLTYSTATPDEIESGIDTLGDLVRARVSARHGTLREATVEATPIF